MTFIGAKASEEIRSVKLISGKISPSLPPYLFLVKNTYMIYLKAFW